MHPSRGKHIHLVCDKNFFRSSLIWLVNIRWEGLLTKCILISIIVATFVALWCAMNRDGKGFYCSFGHLLLSGECSTILCYLLIDWLLRWHLHATMNSELFSRCWKVWIKMSIQMLLSFHIFMWREGRTDLQICVSQNRQWHKNEWSMKLNFRSCAVFSATVIVR